MHGELRLGIRANLTQFSLLVVVNALVGAMVGMERSILSAIAEHEFHLAARAAILTFIVVFGVTKALTNYLAGRLSDAYGRKVILVVGWLIDLGVAFVVVGLALTIGLVRETKHHVSHEATLGGGSASGR